jgi:uncharacterized repeat protein (TIGR04076 family)
MAWPKVKITVLKRASFEDVCREYGEKTFLNRGGSSPCGRFQDGQSFVLDHGLEKPEEFCAYAFGDIRHELMVVLNGGSHPYIGPPGTAIVRQKPERFCYVPLPAAAVRLHRTR